MFAASMWKISAVDEQNENVAIKMDKKLSHTKFNFFFGLIFSKRTTSYFIHSHRKKKKKA